MKLQNSTMASNIGWAIQDRNQEIIKDLYLNYNLTREQIKTLENIEDLINVLLEEQKKGEN